MSLNKTPLYEFHKKNNARLVPFAGWEMPVQYTSIIEEHNAVRQKAGLFDVSHMGEVIVSGTQSVDFLNYLMTNDVSTLTQGKALYTLMCYPNSGVVDDLIIYCLEENSFLLCLNAANTEKDIAWLKQHLGDFQCDVKDASSDFAQLALQGPLSQDILEEFFPRSSEIKRFCFKQYFFQGEDVLIARTGYTGEDGFELYFPPKIAECLADEILNHGQPLGLKLTGLGARDSLRLEAGYSLYGHEISETISPIAANLNFAVKLKKDADFIGKSALAAQKDGDLQEKIIFFKLEGRRIARQGAKIYSRKEIIGEVTSGTLSPTINQPIGSALIKNNDYSELMVDIRGNLIPLLIVKPPFYIKNSKI